MTKATSLQAVITRCHRELDQLFFIHQEAVLVGDLTRAIETLRRFSAAHDRHKNFEDEHLLTRLAEIDDPGDWPASLYAHEHDKINDLLTQLDEHLSRIHAQEPDGTALRAALIELLDREKSFKGLCEHHQEREEKGMLPALDKQTDAAWRASIIEPFVDKWRAMVQVPILTKY